MQESNAESSHLPPWDNGASCPVSTKGREGADSGLMGGEGNGFLFPPRVESEKKRIINVG